MEEQKEIQRQFRQQQEKYVYYIVALNVTAIGFSIYQTTGKTLNCTQIPLGLAIISFGISIYCGLKFLKYLISNLYTNNEYFEILKGAHPEIGNNSQKIQLASGIMKDIMIKNSNNASKFMTFQETFFYFGIILFIVWHIIEMYKNSL